MTWPAVPLPREAIALLLFPSGHRVYDDDQPRTVGYPFPVVIDTGPNGEPGVYHLMHVHYGGEVDAEARALYVLGGHYLPHGTGALRLDPDEALDQ